MLQVPQGIPPSLTKDYYPLQAAVKNLFIFLQSKLYIRTWRIHVFTHMALVKNTVFFLHI
jgi:hypothetical protein